MKKRLFALAIVFSLVTVFSGALPQWQCLDPGIPELYDLSCKHLMTYDDSRKAVTCLFQQNLWEWNGEAWDPIPAENAPSCSLKPQMVYDTSRGIYVLWTDNELWEGNGTRWDPISVNPSPRERREPLWIYDPVREVTHLFGGLEMHSTYHILDHWTWDGTSWSLEDDYTTGPLLDSNYYWGSTAFDEKRGILFWGSKGPWPYDTYHIWEWDGGKWSFFESAIQDGRYFINGGAVYDPCLEKILLAPSMSTWDGKIFTKNDHNIKPGDGRYFGGPVLDRATSHVVYLESEYDRRLTTWDWDGRHWRLKSPVPNIENPYIENYDNLEKVLFYDPARSEMLLLDENGNLFSFQKNDWEPKDCTVQPERKSGYYYEVLTTLDEKTSHVLLLTARAVKQGGNFVAIPSTWEWDGTDWTPDMPTSSPVPLEGSSLVFDSSRSLPLFVGYHLENETSIFQQWNWNGHDWIREFPEHHPSDFSRLITASDPDRGICHLISFHPEESSTADLYDYEHWIWDGLDWTRTPDIRLSMDVPFNFSRLFYNRKQDKLLLSIMDHDTILIYEWDGSGFYQVLERSILYPFNFCGGIEYDPARDGYLLTGESREGFMLFLSFSLSFDQFELVYPELDRPLLNGGSMYFDPESRDLFLLGGLPCFGPIAGCAIDMGDFWERKDGAWKWLWNVPRPGAGENFDLVFDTRRNEALYFGGAYCSTDIPTPMGDTWIGKKDGWNRIYSSPSPYDRWNHAMAWSPPMGKAVLFGGSTIRLGIENDTWFWDGTTWNEAHPTTRPSPRRLHKMAFDETSGKIMLCGGRDEFWSPLRDTWTFDGSNWEELSPPHPPDFEAADMIYNPARRRMTLFASDSDKILEWDGGDWIPLPIPHTPQFDSSSVFSWLPGENAIMVYRALGKPEMPSSLSGSLWKLEFGTTGGITLERLLSHLLGSAPFKASELPGADLNGDGIVDVGDVIHLLANPK